MPKKITISVINDLATDQRVHKQAATLREMGFEIYMIGRMLPQSMPFDKFPNYRMVMLFRRGVLFYTFFQIRLFFILLRKSSHLLIANDLDTLLPNYLAAKIKRIPLVYDSHEYFTEVPELQNSKLKKALWTAVERFIFPKLQHVFTVNDSIAQAYFEKYGVLAKVLRNVPMTSNPEKPDKIKLRQELGLPPDKTIVIMQGSGINVSRGGEEAVLAMSMVDHVLLLVIGSGDAIPAMKLLSVKNNLQDKVRFINKLPYQQLRLFTMAADVGLSLDKDNNLNYKFSLPNKIFDYFQAGIPVIAGSLIEIKKVHDCFNFGPLIPQITVAGVASALQQIKPESEEYKTWQIHVQHAAMHYTWEKESELLVGTFQQFL